MKAGLSRGKVILALKRAIVATFDDSRWLELGYLTDMAGVINGHPRLLRSMGFGDPDYEGHVLTVLDHLLGPEDKNLEMIEEYVGLEDWLRQHEPVVHAELYEAPSVVSLEEVESAARSFDIAELNRQAMRIRKGIRDDPALAIGSAKEMLETILKIAIDDDELARGKDIPELLRLGQRKLDLDPRSVADELPGHDTIRRTLQNLGQVVIGVAEVRNLHGTGHGQLRTHELEMAHARLVVNSAVSVGTYFVEVIADLADSK